MNIRKLTGLLSMATLAGSALAMAQEPQTTTTSPASPSQSRTRTYDRSAIAPSSHQQSSHSGQIIRASQVIGSTVKSSDGKALGQVRDIVVDPQSGRIDFAILALSGATNDASATSSATRSTTSTTAVPPSSTSYSATAGAKLVPVPWELFGQSLSGATALPSSSSILSSGTLGGTMSLTLKVDEAKLRNAPSFDANNWSTLQGSDFGQRSYSYYGLDWNSRMSGIGTAGPGVSSGIGTSSSDRDLPSSQSDSTRPRSSTQPDRSQTDPSRSDRNPSDVSRPQLPK